MASIAGRAIIVPKTNKSGGALAKGDVVIVDAANDNAVTTTTTGSYTGVVGVVVEENGIANNATGRVQFGGHCALVTPNASVTRGHYALTHTVAKQCTDGGASRVVGAFGVFTTGGTTPEIDLFVQPDSTGGGGAVASDAIWDAAGDLAQGTGANTAAKLSAGLAGQMLRSAGAAAANTWAYPPGYEFDYVQITSAINPNATTEATANTVVTANGVAYDGSTIINVEFWAFSARPDSTAARQMFIYLYDDTGGGAASIGRLALLVSPAAAADNKPIHLLRRLTPSAATHTYSIRAAVNAGTGNIGAGAGGSTADMPAFIRQYKV